MRTVLIFVGCLLGIVLLGVVVSKITGSHSYYLDEWKFDADEKVLWRDDAADFSLLPKTGQAVVMTFPRLKWSSVVATNKRILVAQKAAFTSRRVVQYVLYPGASPDGQTAHLGGGKLTVGYESIAFAPGVKELTQRSNHDCIELTPLASEASSTNLSRLLLFTDLASTFPLPTSSSQSFNGAGASPSN